MSEYVSCSAAERLVMFTAQILNTIKSVNGILKSCKIFVGRNPAYIYAPEGYLNGLVTLESMENTVLELKSESAQEALFFQTKKAKKLLGIIEGMKLFITGEEKLLEANAEKFISADLDRKSTR